MAADVFLLMGQSNMAGRGAIADDGTHFDRATLREFGRRYADAIVPLVESRT